MDALLKQMRYSRTRSEKTDEAGSITDRRIPPQKTQNFKEKKNWLQRQFSGKKSQDYDSSNGVEYAATVIAAAAFAINTLDEPGIPDQKKDDKAILTQEAGTGRVSKRFSGESSMKIPESQDRKKPVTAAETTGKAPEKPIGRPPSIKKAPTFAEHLKSPNSIKPDLPTTTPIDIQSQSSRRSATEETEADAWQKAELAKIKDKYEKLTSTLNSWEEKKRKKARSQLDRIESELERRRQKAMDDFRREIEYIEEISVGARQKAMEKRRAEESKAKEKANILRTTGRVPKTCFCC